MNAPGPSNRKRSRDELDEAEDHKSYDGFMDDESEPHKFGTSVLPVAHLPESFDGIPQNGMEYLFTVRREEKRLPLVTRVHNPYSTNDTAWNTQPPHKDDSVSAKVRSALPTEEWRTCFEERFRNFRANIRQPTIHISLPRHAISPGRIPDMRERDRWWAFFRGDIDWEKVPSSQFHAKKYGSSIRTKRKTIDYEEEMPKNQGKMRGWVVYDEHLSWDKADEETEAHAGSGSLGACRNSGAGQAQEDTELSDDAEENGKVGAEHALPTPRGSPNPQTTASGKFALPRRSTSREPTPELLGLIDQKVTLHLLKYFTQWIQGHFDRSFLPMPPPIPEAHSLASSQENPGYNLTPTHARWIFALLSRLDAQLTSGEISVLRTLSREVMRVIKEEISSQDSLSRTTNMSSMGEVASWMVVAAVAGVWGQRDLWMDAEEVLR